MFQEYVAGFLFDRVGKQVVLVRKRRPEWQKGFLNGVGGKIEEGETPAEAMRREFREETAVDLTGWKKFCTSSGRGFRVHFYSLHEDPEMLDAAAMSKHDEPIEVHLVDPILTYNQYACVPNLRWLITMALEWGRERSYEVKQV